MVLTMAAPASLSSQAPGPVGAVSPSSKPAADSGTGVIRGRVVRADTGEPISGARIGGVTRISITDENGQYELTGLRAGQYDIRASRNGFVTQPFGAARSGQAGRPIDLAPGQVVDRADFALARAAVISGIAVDASGEPLVGAPVWVLRRRYVNGEQRLVHFRDIDQANSSDVTDDLGRFRLYGLAPGSYYLAAGQPRRAGAGNSSRRSAGGQDIGDAPTLYPGTISLAAAVPITVAEGTDTSGLSFAVTPVSTATIRGTVTTSAGTGLRPELIIVEHAITGDRFQSASLGPDSSFAIPNLAPGDYSLVAKAGDGVGIARVALGADDVFVAMNVRKAYTVLGRVRLEAERTPASGLPAGFSLGFYTVGLPGVQHARVAADGTFRIGGILGPQRLIVPASDWTVSSVTRNGTDVTDEVIVIDADENDIEITLTRRAPILSGVVRDSRGRPADATVLVFAEDPQKWWPGTNYIRTTRTDRDGRFTIAALHAGRYVAIAAPAFVDGEETNPDVLQQMVGEGTRVELRLGETRTLELRQSRDR